MKLPFLLFFINGSFPSDKDKAEAAAITGAKVVFRNANAVPPEPHALEVCDGVAGAVPPIYANRFPGHAKAVAAHVDALKALSQKVGDIPAPSKRTVSNPQVPAANPNPTSGKPPAWNPNPNPPA